MRILLLLISLILIPNVCRAQVIAPPSLPGQDALSAELAQSINSKNIEVYGNLISNNIKVYEDGNLVANNKAQWINIFGKKLIAKGVYFKVIARFSSTGRLLFLERFNSLDSWGGVSPQHCCWSYDAVSYDIVAGKITIIRRLRGGDKYFLGDSGQFQQSLVKPGHDLPPIK